MSALLEIKNIETYYDLIYAIRGASLTVEEGSITAILGNNGAGKSTILKTVMGLIEDQPDKGTIEFMGKRIDGLDTDRIVRMGITLVPEGREVFEELTIRENLLMGAYIRNDKKGIDTKLSDLGPSLKQPPFSAWSSFTLLAERKVKAQKGQATSAPLLPPGKLTLELQDKVVKKGKRSRTVACSLYADGKECVRGEVTVVAASD